jgi:hypothetical protein
VGVEPGGSDVALAALIGLAVAGLVLAVLAWLAAG